VQFSNARDGQLVVYRVQVVHASLLSGRSGQYTAVPAATENHTAVRVDKRRNTPVPRSG
jgi:hypothetical protein